MEPKDGRVWVDWTGKIVMGPAEAQGIDTTIAPFDWLNDEPAERVYWRAGLEHSPGGRSNGISSYYTSERAAWIARQEGIRSGRYVPALDAPAQTTKEEALAIARENGSRVVYIVDEADQIVEEWTV